jgi:hypothetical protein
MENKIRKKGPSKEKQDQRRSAHRTEAEGKKVALPARLLKSRFDSENRMILRVKTCFTC